MTLSHNADDREIAEAVDSLDRAFSVRAAARLVAALARKHGIETTWTTDRTPCAMGRQIFCPRPETPEAFAVWLHEAGHCLSGECPNTAPHRGFKVENAWRCIECETLASARALSLAPFSAPMHARLAAGMRVYLRTTSAPADAKARARRFVNGASWREAIHRRAEQQIRMDKFAEIQRIAASPRLVRRWELQWAEIQQIVGANR